MSAVLWDNFIESTAQILSRVLTNDEREKIVASIRAIGTRIHQLSRQNLKQVEEAAAVQGHKKLCLHDGPCAVHCVRGFLLALVKVFGAKYALGLLPALLTGRVFKRPEILRKLAGRDTISFTLFLSSFIGIYKTLLCSLRSIRRVSDPVNSFLAGVGAGTALFIDSNPSRRLMVALYLSTRTGHFLCRWIWRRYVDKPLIRDEEDRLEKLKSPAVSIENLSPKSSSSSTSFDGSNSKTDSELFEKQQEIIRQSLTKKKWADRIKEQFRQFNAVLLMVVSGSQIIYSFALEPDTLARPYLSFLLSHSGLRAQYKHRDRDFLNLLGESLDASRVAGTSKILPGPDWIDSLDPAFPIERALSFAEVANSSIDHDFIMCKLQHPSSPHCSSAMVSMFYQEFWRALAMYGPLNALMLVVFKGKGLMNDSFKTFKRSIQSIVRSSIFLSAFVTGAWSGPCYIRRVFGTDRPWMYFVNGGLAGLTVLIEIPARRLELALYCLPRAIESFWRCGVKWGRWKYLPGGEAIYFSLATGFLMSLYQEDPESIHEGYRKVMTRVIGIN